MKTNLLRTTINTAVASALLTGLSLSAQMPGGGAPGGIGAALTRLFGDNKAFTAKADVRVLDGSQQELASMPMEFAFLDNKTRMEMDLTQMKNKQMPPGMADSLKQMGMAQFVNIIRPDKKLVYSMYPNMKVVLSQPLPKAETEAADNPPKMEKTELGKETLDGHPCVKNKIVFAGEDGKPIEATTWNAADLKDFPVQIQTKDNENTSILRFKDVQLIKPDEKLFDPPEDFTVYTDQMALQQAVMKKMMEGAQKK
jgi:hypothetical protein